MTSKIKEGKKREKSINEIRTNYKQKESSLVLTVYRLEKEIEDLVSVLNWQKIDIENYLRIIEQQKSKVEELEQLKVSLGSNLKSSDDFGKFMLQNNNDLNEQILVLEQSNQSLKEDKTSDSFKIKELQRKNESLSKKITQLETSLGMMQAEMGLKNRRKKSGRENWGRLIQ